MNEPEHHHFPGLPVALPEFDVTAGLSVLVIPAIDERDSRGLFKFGGL
jgi:hypothetical protein